MHFDFWVRLCKYNLSYRLTSCDNVLYLNVTDIFLVSYELRDRVFITILDKKNSENSPMRSSLFVDHAGEPLMTDTFIR